MKSLLLVFVLGCSGASVDPLDDAGTDAAEDHKVGVVLDVGSDVSMFGDSAPITACYREYDASAPPFDCSKEHDQNNNPLPYKFICPLDAGQYPSGTAGVTCIEEAFIGSDTSLWCCGN